MGAECNVKLTSEKTVKGGIFSMKNEDSTRPKVTATVPKMFLIGSKIPKLSVSND